MTVRHIALDPQDRRITAADFAIVAGFYQARGATGPTRHMLPACGFIAESADRRPLACAFLYLDATGSGVANLAWVASDPAAPIMARGRAVKACLHTCLAVARRLNYWLIMGSFNTPSLIRTLRAHGWHTGDCGTVHLYHNLHTIPWDSQH